MISTWAWPYQIIIWDRCSDFGLLELEIDVLIVFLPLTLPVSLSGRICLWLTMEGSDASSSITSQPCGAFSWSRFLALDFLTVEIRISLVITGCSATKCIPWFAFLLPNKAFEMNSSLWCSCTRSAGIDNELMLSCCFSNCSFLHASYLAGDFEVGLILIFNLLN